MELKIPEHIKNLIPYEPGKPLEELERELGIKNSIKLASNENPIGPSPEALRAIEKILPNIHRYPDGSGFYLKKTIAEYFNLRPQNIILGNGSNEIIELSVRTFLNPGDEIVMADQSFIVYQIVTQSANCKGIIVPLRDFTHDLDRMADAVTEKTRMVFISNPNNPTGTAVGRKDVERFMGRLRDDIIVIFDEAYYEYVERKDFPDTLKYVGEGKNVIVLRTFSKIYGMAGLRIGYGFARDKLVGYMNRVRQPFNVNSLALIGAVAALKDKNHLERSREVNKKGKEYLYGEFKKLGLNYVPSEANFILVKTGNGRNIYNRLLKKGIIIRPLDGYKFPDYIRVTIGLPEENKRFIEALKEK
ncbi:MAG: histidinol-phosphate transaminase [Nitrospinota bacterium]